MTAILVTPPIYRHAAMEWDPYDEVNARDHIEFRLAALPDITGGAIYWPHEGWAAIVVDGRLHPRAQATALTHELIHDERGGGARRPGQPPAWGAVVRRDELAVDREVAARHVPRSRLVAFIQQRMSVEGDGGVTITEVAEEFEVPDHVAERALRSLADNPVGWEAA